MLRLAARFARDEGGATSIEYALMAGLVGAGIVAALSSFSGGLSGMIAAVADKVGAAPKP